MGLNLLLWALEKKTILRNFLSCHKPYLWRNMYTFVTLCLHPYDEIFVWLHNLIMWFTTVTTLHPRWTKINWLLVRKRILTKPCRWPALKGQVFSLWSTSALILIELKAISEPFKRHTVGAPLAFSPSVTCPLWSISSTWTIHPFVLSEPD